MIKNLVLKLIGLLSSRKVGQEKNEQKNIVAGDNNIVIIKGNK